MRNLLPDALVWSCLIEIRDIGIEDPMQLLLTEDQYIVKALSSHTAQKAFTDGIGSWRLIGYGENLDAARCCNSGETRSKLPIIIANEIRGGLSIRSRLSQLLCGPGIGRKSCHTYVDDLPRFQFNEEKRKERTKEEGSRLEKITGPDFPGMIAEERRPPLPSWAR